VIETSTATAWYVYGIAEADSALERIPGVAVICRGSLAALVREVPLDDFDETVLPERLNDRDWLETNAREHEGVLESAAAVTTVVPLRFGTIYRHPDQVVQMLDDRADELAATLERVRGHIELGVKVWADLDETTRSLGTAADEPAAPGQGAAYLQRRRQEQERSRELSALCADLAGEAHARLSAVSAGAVANRPQPSELTGRSDAMLLNGAYLVRKNDDRLEREVERLAAEHAELGLEYELTGPWPPHNFAEPPE
jgi:gas vesicle protein GvpL/GvpF